MGFKEPPFQPRFFDTCYSKSPPASQPRSPEPKRNRPTPSPLPSPPRRRVGWERRRVGVRPSPPFFSSAGQTAGPSPPRAVPAGRAAAVPAAYSSQDPSGREAAVPSSPLPSRPLLFEKAPEEFRVGSCRRAVAPPLGAALRAGAGGAGRRRRRPSARRCGEKWAEEDEARRGGGGDGTQDAVNTRVNPSHARREGKDPAPGLDPAAPPRRRVKAKEAGALADPLLPAQGEEEGEEGGRLGEPRRR